MQKQKVFIPVDAGKEKPEIEQCYFTYSEDEWMDKKVPQSLDVKEYLMSISEFAVSNNEAQPSHWLKEEEGYFFTAEELKNIIGNAYAECFTNHGEDCSEDEYYKLKNEYIESLNIKYNE